MRKISKYINWLFQVSYQYTTIKYKNIAMNAVFFVSFIFTNLINFILNILFFFFEISKINALYYLVTLIIVTAFGGHFFLKKSFIDKIPKEAPSKKEVFILDAIFIFSVILFFGSLALIA